MKHRTSYLHALALPAALAAALAWAQVVPGQEVLIVASGGSIHRSTDPNNPAGPTWQQLNIPAGFGAVDISPDGTRLCYVRTGLDPDDFGQTCGWIYLYDLTDGTETEVMDHGTAPRWLDNENILYLWSGAPVAAWPGSERGDARSVWSMNVNNANTGERLFHFDWSQVTPSGYYGSLELSPDRRFILSNPQNGAWSPTQDLYVCDLVATPPILTVYEDRNNNTCDTRQLWLLGDRFVWCRYARAGAYVYDMAIVAASITTPQTYRALTDWKGWKYPIAASPDGTKILFMKVDAGKGRQTDPNRPSRMWIMDADGSNARVFTGMPFPGLWSVEARWISPQP